MKQPPAPSRTRVGRFSNVNKKVFVARAAAPSHTQVRLKISNGKFARFFCYEEEDLGFKGGMARKLKPQRVDNDQQSTATQVEWAVNLAERNLLAALDPHKDDQSTPEI
jgi:hypothetical protein